MHLTPLGRKLVGRCRNVDISVERERGKWIVWALLYPALDLGLTVWPREKAAAGGPRVLMPHAGMNMRYMVCADERERVIALLPRAACNQIIQAFDSRTALTLSDVGAQLMFSDEAEPHHVMPFVDRLACLVSSINGQRKQVPASSALWDQLQAWLHLAHQHQLEGLNTPLCVWGETAGGTMHAFARRTALLKYQLVVAVHFRTPLAIGMVLGPKSFTQRLLEVNDAHTGDDAFDDAFLLQTSDPERAISMLGDATRSALMALLEQTGDVQMDDNGVTLAVPGDQMPGPDEAYRLIQQMVGLADHIEASRRAGMRAGPYR